jgi:hypothetical protein
MKTTNLKNDLLKGIRFELSNEQFQEAIKNDDIRSTEIWFDKGTIPGFKIWFNGKTIHISKTFASFEKRLNKLINDWNLK